MEADPNRKEEKLNADSANFPQQQQSQQVVTSAVDFIKPWLSYTAAQAQELRRTVANSTDTALQSARSHLGELQSHRLQSTQDFFDHAWSQYSQYEDAFFGRLKDGLQSASSHPAISYSVVAGLSLLLMKRPRRLLFRYTIGRFQSDESLLVNSEKKVMEMRQSMNLLKNERKKLEERARFAEDELQRGHIKLKQSGSQLQNLINSIEKTENQARGLMDSLRELPAGDALKFRAEVASMAAEAKQQRAALSRKVTKIANYGIAV